jgi:hypothetical protein
MSSEWTVVKSGNKKVTVVETNVSEKVRQTKMEQKKFREDKQKQWEARQQQNKANWEARRQSKIDEYDREFPLLPGSRDTMTEAQKIAYIDTKRAAKKEADKQAYLQREARRQAKREIAEKRAAEKAKREAELAEMEEREHVKNMIEKWGAHRWYNMVSYTDDDCDTAQKLRDEEEEREYQQEKWYEEQERQLEKEYEQQKIADEKYIAEQTANMSEKEKELFISEFDEQRMRWLEDGMEAEGDIWYRDFQIMEKQKKQDSERLAAWEAKNKKI